jgi:hypothetical protein
MKISHRWGTDEHRWTERRLATEAQRTQRRERREKQICYFRSVLSVPLRPILLSVFIGAPSVADLPLMNWLKSDAGLVSRVAVGVLVFSLLAAVDLRRHGRSATRWREYLFLLLCVGVAMVYGAVNDQVTSSISWEYFYYGKELDKVLGPGTPPDAVRLHLHAAVVGMMATWSAGLLIGVALLLANNPRRDRPRLRYAELTHMLGVIFVITACCGAVGGVLGYFGGLTWASDDFREMMRSDLFRPRRFIAAWGVHLGGYLGGLVGTIVEVTVVMRRRRRLIPSPSGSGLG